MCELSVAPKTTSVRAVSAKGGAQRPADRPTGPLTEPAPHRASEVPEVVEEVGAEQNAASAQNLSTGASRALPQRCESTSHLSAQKRTASHELSETETPAIKSPATEAYTLDRGLLAIERERAAGAYISYITTVAIDGTSGGGGAAPSSPGPSLWLFGALHTLHR